jgi:hypothetical protein
LPRRVEQRAHDVETVLSPLTALAECLAALPAVPPVPAQLRRGSLLEPHAGAAPASRVSEVEALIARGERLAEALRRGPAAARPRGRDVTSWRREASFMVAYFRALNPEWLVGYESALTGRDRRMINSMW